MSEKREKGFEKLLFKAFFRGFLKKYRFFCKKYRKIIDFYVILMYNSEERFENQKCAFLHQIRSGSFREKASGYRI